MSKINNQYYMKYAAFLNNEVVKYFGSYLLKLIAIFLAMWAFHYVFWGLVGDGGTIYSSFLDHYLNYIDWTKNFLMVTSNFFAQLFGLNTVVNGLTLRVINGTGVILGGQCIGFGIMGFWIAFINAQSSSWKRKLIWTVAGLSSILIINCLRISILLFALQNKWKVNKFMDHHDMFNLVAYSLILFMIYLYHVNEKKNENVALAAA